MEINRIKRMLCLHIQMLGQPRSMTQVLNMDRKDLILSELVISQSLASWNLKMMWMLSFPAEVATVLNLE